jgi:hypothetical protein
VKREGLHPSGARISNAKNAFLGADELEEREGDEYDEIASVVVPEVPGGAPQRSRRSTSTT